MSEIGNVTMMRTGPGEYTGGPGVVQRQADGHVDLTPTERLMLMHQTDAADLASTPESLAP